jgi:O-antigen/teichoic acid export membrane protein
MRGKLVKGTAWIVSARTFANLATSVGMIVLARILAPADFGLVALGTTMLAVLSSVTDLSLTSALVQHQDPTLEHYHTAWTLNALRGAVIAAAFALATIPAIAFYHEPRLAVVMPCLALGLLVSGLSNPRMLMLTKQLVFWQQFMLQVTQKLVTLVVSVGVAIVFRNYWALICGALAGQATGVLLSYIVLPFRPRIGFRHSRELFGFSVWLTLGQIVSTLSLKLDQLLIGGVLGRSALGYYTVGDSLAATPTRETTAPITNTLFPAFSQLTRDRERLAAAYQSAQGLVTSIALPAGVGMAMIADPLVRLVMGEKWLPAVFVIQVLASILALQTIGTLSQPLSMAAGETRLLFKRDLQALILRAPLIVVGMALGGLHGIVWARSVNGILVIVLHMQVVKQITGLSLARQVGANARSLASAAAMAVVLFRMLPSHPHPDSGAFGLAYELVVLMVAGASTYIGAHLVLWQAMGRPKGPEREVARVAVLLVRRLRPAVAAAS